MLDRTELIPVVDGERRTIGPFDCQFIPVTHSVPARLRDRVLHARSARSSTRGDFKLDLTPVDGRRTNLALLGEIARRERRRPPAPAPTPPTPSARASRRRSRRSARRCATLFREHPDKRFIVASFASHLHRVQQVARGRDRRRPQDRVRRPVDGAQRHDGARAAASSTFPSHAVIDIEETPQLRARRGVHHLHRFAGRADERAVAHGRARAQAREGLATTTSWCISAHAIPGNEIERVARHRLAAPRRRRGRARRQRRRCTSRVTRRRKS